MWLPGTNLFHWHCGNNLIYSQISGNFDGEERLMVILIFIYSYGMNFSKANFCAPKQRATFLQDIFFISDSFFKVSHCMCNSYVDMN